MAKQVRFRGEWRIRPLNENGVRESYVFDELPQAKRTAVGRWERQQRSASIAGEGTRPGRQRIVAEYPETKEAAAARKQVENLWSAVNPELPRLGLRPPPDLYH
jgi:hypothetical protein